MTYSFLLAITCCIYTYFVFYKYILTLTIINLKENINNCIFLTQFGRFVIIYLNPK